MPGLKKDVYCYYKIDKYIATINGEQNVFEKNGIDLKNYLKNLKYNLPFAAPLLKIVT